MKRFHLVLLLGTMLSLFSCTHKELCMEHPHMAPLRLEFDWRDAPSATAKLVHQILPRKASKPM